jgi:hypothetical protein
MALPLDMDVHVPAVITESLRRKMLDVLTSQEDGTGTRDEVLNRTPSRGGDMAIATDVQSSQAPRPTSPTT